MKRCPHTERAYLFDLRPGDPQFAAGHRSVWQCIACGVEVLDPRQMSSGPNPLLRIVEES